MLGSDFILFSLLHPWLDSAREKLFNNTSGQNSALYPFQELPSDTKTDTNVFFCELLCVILK